MLYPVVAHLPGCPWLCHAANWTMRWSGNSLDKPQLSQWLGFCRWHCLAQRKWAEFSTCDIQPYSGSRQDWPLDKSRKIKDYASECHSPKTRIRNVATPIGGSQTIHLPGKRHHPEWRCGGWCEVSYWEGGSHIFQRMTRIWTSPYISFKIKLLYTSIVIPTTIYTSETWNALASINSKFHVFQQRCLCHILNLRRSDSAKLHNIIAHRRLRLASHVLHMDSTQILKRVMHWVPPGTKRPCSCPQNMWRRTFTQNLKVQNTSWDAAETLAQDRNQWQTFATQNGI